MDVNAVFLWLMFGPLVIAVILGATWAVLALVGMVIRDVIDYLSKLRRHA